MLSPAFRSVLSLALLALALAHPVRAQTAKEAEGTWKLDSVVATVGEKKTDLFGPSPKGRMVLGPDGNFTIVITRADLPKFAADVRTKGTPDENKAVVHGTVGFWGRWSVEGTNLVLAIEGSTYPNWVGQKQERVLKVVGDELSYTTPPAKSGGTTTLAWKRLR
jgi:hypothetical protein